MNEKLIDLMADLKEEEVYTLGDEMIKCGRDPMEILDQARSVELIKKALALAEAHV
jgi:hypothetical protein